MGRDAFVSPLTLSSQKGVVFPTAYSMGIHECVEYTPHFQLRGKDILLPNLQNMWKIPRMYLHTYTALVISCVQISFVILYTCLFFSLNVFSSGECEYMDKLCIHGSDIAPRSPK